MAQSWGISTERHGAVEPGARSPREKPQPVFHAISIAPRADGGSIAAIAAICVCSISGRSILVRTGVA
jgi:hypothetical protein